MAIDKEVKKKILEDWQNAFPDLKKYAQNKLYKIVGCFVIGIEIIKSPHFESYSPYFVIYPLWKNDIKACMAYPIFLREFSNKKGAQFDIPFDKHKLYIDDILVSIKNQLPLPFEGNISIAKIINAIDECSRTPPFSASYNSYLQAILQESKLKGALFMSIDEAQKIMEQINKRTWDISHFKSCGVDVIDWFQELRTSIVNRDEFLKKIEENKKDKKIAKLVTSEIII